MNIEHFIGLSWVHESTGAETKRPCARWRDAGRESLAISVRRSCHGLFVSNGVHPSDGTGILPVTPSRRIAAGHAARTFKSPRAKTRAKCARVLYSTANVVLFKQRLVTRLVLPLDVIEQRTACGDHFQKAPARMIVLHVGFEMPGEVIDAFRQDRDLNLGRAGIAGLVGIGLDDFRFTFCGNRHRQTLSLLRTGLAVSPVRLNTRLGMSSPLPISARARSRPATVT